VKPVAQAQGGTPGLGPGNASRKRFLGPTALLFCVLCSLLMVVLQPIPHGHNYGMALKLSAVLAGIWFVYRVKPDLVFTKGMRIFVLVVGLGVCIGGFISLRPAAEIVPHYASVFEAVQAGRNPYTCGTIFHRTEFGQPVLGNFNYPPMEIYPYYLLYLAAGTWNIWILTFFKLAIHGLACLIFLWTFPEIKRKYLLPFLPLFLFLEIQQNPSMALLMTALVLFAIKKNGERPLRGGRYVIAVLFGIGLMTKFLIIPLMAAYYWHKFDPKRLRSLLEIASEAGIALATSVLIMLPYGVAAVFKNTILFNLVLKDRNAFTAFYPNILSGLFTWIRLEGLYPFAAVGILGLSILAAPKLKVHSAMLAAAFTFLLVAPTPRSQFLPLVVYLALAGIIVNLEGEGAIPPAAGGQSALRRHIIR
jgi:hypothetical protein